MSLGNAYLALKNISGALEAFRQALKLTTKCPECENSLKLIRCMQFYPFLYNITSSVCSGKQLLNAGKIMSSIRIPVLINRTQKMIFLIFPRFLHNQCNSRYIGKKLINNLLCTCLGALGLILSQNPSLRKAD